MTNGDLFDVDSEPGVPADEGESWEDATFRIGDPDDYEVGCRDYTLGWAGGAALMAAWMGVIVMSPLPLESVATGLFAFNFAAAHAIIAVAYTRPVAWYEFWEDPEEVGPGA